MNTDTASSALVCLSGGQDSATCLAIALSECDYIETVSFDYNQRHRIELELATKLANRAKVTHTQLDATYIQALSINALTQSDMTITESSDGLPNTFVPGRNALFLTMAASFAYQKQIRTIYTGVCETDYSGYPDCRAPFIDAIAKAIGLAMDTSFDIRTPLMTKTKADTVKWMQSLGRLDWYADTHTCYEGHRPACGKCPACTLRLRGFSEAGLSDPIAYHALP